MLDRANKYAYVQTAGHNITGTISLNDQVLRWENVSWMNEAVGEWASVLGISGLGSYDCANFLRASDVQRVITWMNGYDGRTISNDGSRFFTSWTPGSSAWTKIGDYTGNNLTNVLYNAELAASAARWTPIHSAKRLFALGGLAVAAGDPVRVAPIRQILNAFPNGWNVSVYNYLRVIGSMTVTRSDTSSTVTSNILSPRSTSAGVYRNVNDHARYLLRDYSGGSVSYQLSTDTAVSGDTSVQDSIGSRDFIRSQRHGGAILACSYRSAYNQSTRTTGVACSTYYHEFFTVNGVITNELDWSTLKGLSAPAVATPSSGQVIEGVYLFQLNVDPGGSSPCYVPGITNLKFNSSIYN